MEEVCVVAGVVFVAFVAFAAGRPLLSSGSQRLPDCQNLQGFYMPLDSPPFIRYTFIESKNVRK